MNRVGLGASLFAFVLYATISVVQWTNAYSPSWDLGIFTQLARAYADLTAPIVPIKGPDFNLLGDHFHPILVLLAPFYWLHPSGLTLLLVQAGLFAVSAYPIATLATDRFGPRAGAVFSFVYPLSWMLVNAQWSQFHEIAFAVPLLAYGLVWWLRGKHTAALVAVWLLVFVKEDLGLTVAAFGVAIFIESRDHLRTGLASIAWGIGWFITSTFVILPALNPAGEWDYADNVSFLEQSMAGLGMKLTLVSILVLTAGVVGITSPLILMVGPTLAWRFVGNVEYYWGWDYHYSAVLAPIIAVALLTGVTRETKKIAAAVSIAATLAMVPVSRMDIIWDHPAREYPGELISAASSYDAVASDITLLAYLAPVTEVYWYGSMGEAPVEAVFLDRWRLDGDPVAWTEDRIAGSWQVEYLDNNWVILVRSQ